MVVAREYRLHLKVGDTAVFQHMPTGKYFAAVQIGEPSMLLCGDTVFQQDAHIKIGTPLEDTDLIQGPYVFYDLVFLLEAGAVTPRGAISDGYVGRAIFSLSGHLRNSLARPLRKLLHFSLSLGLRYCIHRRHINS